jgi:hypothetical protein
MAFIWAVEGLQDGQIKEDELGWESDTNRREENWAA